MDSEERIKKLETDLSLANEEIRHAYNDNETHRRRIAELETRARKYEGLKVSEYCFLTHVQNCHKCDRMECCDNHSPEKKRWLKLEAVVEAARGFYEAIIKWNESVETIIGRQPKTGIPIEALGKALSALED